MSAVIAQVIKGAGSIPFLQFFGKTSKFTLLCGECGMLFKKRFSIIETEGRYPYCQCNHCGSLNRVPLYFDGYEMKRGELL